MGIVRPCNSVSGCYSSFLKKIRPTADFHTAFLALNAECMDVFWDLLSY